MRLYSRTRDDQLNACKRSYFDARHGRVSIALDRLADVQQEEPQDNVVAASALEQEGNIRRDFLGQGFRAYQCFERALELYSANDYYFPVINATLLAPSRADFDKWVGRFKSCVPKSEVDSHRIIDGRLKALENGTQYLAILDAEAGALGQVPDIGQAAANVEIVLAKHKFSPDEEASKRRWRAQQLRKLDQKDYGIREAHLEYFPANERLALIEALEEMERSITCDEYDAEAWNLKSVYCLNLEQWEEALTASEKAIELRPTGYAKPHINRALALWALKRDNEALSAAQEALRLAQLSGDASDQQSATNLARQFAQPRPSTSLAALAPLLQQFVTKSKMIASAEIQESGKDPNIVIGGFFNRCRKRARLPSREFVAPVAELLSDFSPERVYQIISSLPRISTIIPVSAPGLSELGQVCYDRCLHAMLFVVAYSEGVMQRDAARFLCLTFLSAGSPQLIRSTYREVILATSAAAKDQLSQLDNIMRQELARIHRDLPQLVANQNPISDAELENAQRDIVSRLEGSRSCGVLFVLICIGVAVLLYLIIR